MKFFIVLLASVASFSAWSKDVKDFNSELIKNVQKDIQNDNDDQFRKKNVSRGPASVEAEQVKIVPTPKVEKMNQIGPNKW